mgnify:CR=1 FL=1
MPPNTPERFTGILHDELGCRAVWPPVVSPVRLGDYGVLDGGVFRKLGHISDFGVELQVEQGQPASLNFVSASARLVRSAGDLPVTSFSGIGGVQARLRVEFAEKASFLLKCSRISVEQIANIGAIGRQLARARTRDGQEWSSWSWRIVWQVYTGRDVVFLGTRSVDTVVDFTGKVEAVRQLEAGSFSAGVRVQPSSSLALEIVGRTGPVGLNLAKVKLFTAAIGFLSDNGEPEDGGVDLAPDDPPDIRVGDDAGAGDAPTMALSFALEHDEDPEPEPEASDERATWEDLERDATDPADQPTGPLSFGDDAPIDTSSPARWLQSCLRRVVDPELAIDGRPGVRTRRAIVLFQRQAGLRADGIAGPLTLAALQARTGVAAPAGAPDGDPGRDALPPSASPTAVVRELPRQGGRAVRSYAVRLGDDEVRFSTWSDPEGDDHNVSAYEGARADLLTDADLRALGARPGAIKILRANALKESGGKFGAVNTWDDQIVSWGMAQFAGHAGTLAALLASVRDDPACQGAWRRFFLDQGLGVAHGPYPSRTRGSSAPHERIGWHAVVVDEAGRRLAGDAAWAHVRSQPRLVGALMLAGNDRAIQLAQCRFWLEYFLDRAVGKVVVRGPAGNHTIGEYLTSEYALGLVARLHNWMPAYVAAWFGEFLTELAAGRRGQDLRDPAAWRRDPTLERDFCELLKARRRAVKKGSYDTYGGDLDRAPGSFFRAG